MKDNLRCVICETKANPNDGVTLNGKFVCNECQKDLVIQKLEQYKSTQEKETLIKAEFRISQTLKNEIEDTILLTEDNYSEYCRKALEEGHKILKDKLIKNKGDN
jgi:recombinational DNA repair protein (RecF pathway)